MTWLSIHDPEGPGTAARATLVLAHGAGGDRDQAMLRLLGEELAQRAVRTVRIDLPFRRQRPKGPPSPSGQTADRASFAETVRLLDIDGPVLWGGHSYGGRMASMAVGEPADGAALPDGLVLLSYPLHPPGRPEKARTAHLPGIEIPTVLVHGKRDPFASPEELAEAAELITGPTTIVEVAAAHDLAPAKSGAPARAADAIVALLDQLNA
ncbi:alpha/beta fold hydrolase [Tsukamurella pseudospumae]|uniref:Alpha/beta hydrolase n=1 Tax=Tsukamurella pseudospumae TaxID=239498 RepID=A0A138A3V1_9ACTN|nr:alpha/beta fold hydrolase [Tsukamurella pseudospumae]KXO96249.1 alpha/beta hydrolase [Tsukamurella pseudospumae]KXP05101.1 alpha/beta hydrolase [Tsukamurella pseudospumae]